MTSFDGLFVVANVVDGGGDFPVERTADVKEEEDEEGRHCYAKRESGC